MKKSSVRAQKREQRKIKGFTISKMLYYDIFEKGDKDLYQALNDYYKLFLFGHYGNVSIEENTANRRARKLQQGQIRAYYSYGVSDLFYIFDYRRHQNGLIRVMYSSEAKACNETYTGL